MSDELRLDLHSLAGIVLIVILVLPFLLLH